MTHFYLRFSDGIRDEWVGPFARRLDAEKFRYRWYEFPHVTVTDAPPPSGRIPIHPNVAERLARQREEAVRREMIDNEPITQAERVEYSALGGLGRVSRAW